MSKTKEELQAEIELLELEIKARKLRLELESLQPKISPVVGPDKDVSDILERLQKQEQSNPYVPPPVMPHRPGYPWPDTRSRGAWCGVTH